MGACSSKSAHPADDSAAARAPHARTKRAPAPQAHFALSSSAMSNAGAWALYCPRTVQHADPVTPADHFVERRGSELFLNGAKFRFASLNAPELLDGDCNGEFEVRDTFAALAAEGAFGTAVTRTYTLRVRPLPPLCLVRRRAEPILTLAPASSSRARRSRARTSVEGTSTAGATSGTTGCGTAAGCTRWTSSSPRRPRRASSSSSPSSTRTRARSASTLSLLACMCARRRG